MKIAHLIAPERLAGAERHVLELSYGLQQRNCEVVLLCSRDQNFMFEAARQQGVRATPVDISAKHPLKEPLSALRLAIVLQREKVDLVATHLYKATLWGGFAGKIARIPVVSTVHAPRNACHHYGRSQAVIAVSQAVRDAVVAHRVDERKVKVVYHGINTAQFSPPSRLENAKKYLGLPEDALILGVVAHLSAHKGHAWAMEALAPLFKTFPHLHWLFVGDGPEQIALELRAARLQLGGRVHFAGFQHDVVPYFAAMDVLVLPSLEAEGLGLVLAEAGAMEKPVITCDSGGAAEVVVPNETGFIVPPGNAQVLQVAVKALVSDASLRARLGSKGRSRVLEKFSHHKMTQETLMIYREVLGL